MQVIPTEFDSLRHFEFCHPKLRKGAIAKRLKVRPSRYSYLRDPETYRPTLSDKEARAIASLLKRDEEFVRELYRKAAA